MSFVSFYANDMNKEIWIMIIQVSLLTDLISIDRLFVRAWIISKKIDEYDMEGNKLPKFEDWEAEKIKDPDFLAAAEELEFGYQVARLRMVKCLTQAQLAEMVGTRQPSIARLENGTSTPSLSFLTKIAEALGVMIEFKLIPDTK